MSTFVMMGKYSDDSLKMAGTKRTQRALALLEEHGGEASAIYALLGEWDLIIIADFKSIEGALAASVDLNTFTGIAFSTLPAISVAEFDRMLDAEEE